MRVLLGWIHATTLHNCARPTTRLRTKMVRLRHTMNDATHDGTNDSYFIRLQHLWSSGSTISRATCKMSRPNGPSVRQTSNAIAKYVW